MTSAKRCPRCDQPIENSSSGSITQWLFRCACSIESTSASDSDENGPRLLHCKKCNRRIYSGRHGSFTQYVLRSDSCPCEEPIPFEPGPQSANSSSADASLSIRQADEEPPLPDESELRLSPEKFPVDRFTPIQAIGRGASGSVYLSKDRILKKHVAVKTLNVLTASQLIAFQGEARLISKLDHANIVRIQDIGVTAGGAPYMVLEHINGSTLYNYLETHGPLEEPAAVDLFCQICDALEYANSRNILHRDLKPSNVMLIDNDDGSFQVKLVDFGLARMIEAAHQSEQTTTMVGTPQYMSPDQARGMPYRLPSEIYSIGCLLFETLSGEPPFQSDNDLELLSMHAHSSPPTPAGSIRMQKIVARCLEKNPEDRYQSFHDLRSDLQGIESEKGDQSCHDQPVRRQSDKPKRHWPVYLGLGMALTCGLSLWLINCAEGDHSPTGPLEKELNVGNGEWRTLTSKAWQEYSNEKITEWQEPGEGLGVKMSGLASDEQLQRLKKYNYIYRLDAARNALTGEGFKYVPALTIVKLDMTANPIDAGGLAKVAAIRGLESLCLNKMPTLKNDELRALTRAANLRVLSLSGQNLTEKALAALKGTPKLHAIELTGFSLTSVGVEYMKDLDISTLGMVRCSITPEAMHQFNKLKRLEVLSIFDIAPTPEHATKLAQLKLKLLRLVNCRPSLAAQKILANSKSIKSFELIDCGRLTDTEKKALSNFQGVLRIEPERSPNPP
ncbi:MAG: serine/threonine protein kinase [Cyanobacteria bacterium]|nr:serine/threonine protein kinase [Cyanobacteriota bacterium]